MKKAKQSVTVDEPMGIAWGSVAQSAPRVRAFLWCDVEYSIPSPLEDGSHLAKP
jgi:hypothetical protein